MMMSEAYREARSLRNPIATNDTALIYYHVMRNKLQIYNKGTENIDC